MFSLLFFLFVAFVLVMGFVVVSTVRRKKKVGGQVNEEGLLKRNENERSTRSYAQNTFRAEKRDSMKGSILPTDSKRSEGNARDQEQLGN